MSASKNIETKEVIIWIAVIILISKIFVYDSVTRENYKEVCKDYVEALEDGEKVSIDDFF